MHAALLVLASAVVGVDWGYRPLPTGGIEYIVQLEPRALDDLAAGGSEIVSQVPPELYDVRKFRLTVGKQKLPRGGRIATPAKQQTAADGVQVTPASLTGGGNEHVVELDRASIDQMKREMDLVYEVQNVRRYRIRLRQAAGKPTRVEQVSGTMTESPTAEGNPPRPTETAAAKSAPMPMPTELETAPPFVPTAAVRNPYPFGGTPEEATSRGPAAPEATKPSSDDRARLTPQPMRETAEPEPLKIDLAPAPDSTPRPLKPMPTDVAAPPVEPMGKPSPTNVTIPDSEAGTTARKGPSRSNETKSEESREPTVKPSASDPFSTELHVPETSEKPVPSPVEDRRTPEPRSVVPAGKPADWPPVGPTNLPAIDGTPKSAETSKSKPAGGLTDDNPFAAPPNAVPTAAEVKLTPEPKARPETLPASAKTAPPVSDEPATTQSAKDPFPPSSDNPLRGPLAEAPARNELRSPPGRGLGAAADQPPAGDPFAAPPSSAPAGRGADNPPASETMPPAFGGFPPLNTPGGGSTANPPAAAAKTGGGPSVSPPTTSDGNNPFSPSPFGGAPAAGGTTVPGNDPAAQPADGTRNVSPMPDRNDPFSPSPLGGTPAAGGTSLPGNEPVAKPADGALSAPAAATGPNSSFPSAFGAPAAAGSTSPPVAGPFGAGSLDNPSQRTSLPSDSSSGPDHFSGSQPPALPRTGFNDESRPPEMGGLGKGPAERTTGTAADRQDEPAGPATSTPAPGDKKPWWALTGALVVLFSSLGGNVYLGWMNWDLRRQYAALLDMFKQQRANKGRASNAV